jgi:5-methylcytosine-specific restriction protein A
VNPAINRKRWERVRVKAKERDGWKCTQCGSMRSLEVDHIKPIADGGEMYNLENLSTKCRICHRAKSKLENIVSIPERDRLYQVLERVLLEGV